MVNSGTEQRAEHRILLVREWDTQVAASGCCGRLGGEKTEFGDSETFAHNRAEMERMGEVYRALKAALFDAEMEIDISVVDPRNSLWLAAALLGDARRRGLSAGEMWRSLRYGISYNSIVVDGRVLFSGRIPDSAAAVAAVREDLGFV